MMTVLHDASIILFRTERLKKTVYIQEIKDLFYYGTKYTNIVLISDYNKIPNEYFIAANNSCKTLTLE